MTFVARSSSIASPKVFVRKRIFVPSCDQSARSPNHVTCVMCAGKWSAGLSPGLGSAPVTRQTTPSNATERSWCLFMTLSQVLSFQRFSHGASRRLQIRQPHLGILARENDAVGAGLERGGGRFDKIPASHGGVHFHKHQRLRFKVQWQLLRDRENGRESQGCIKLLDFSLSSIRWRR